MVNFYLRFKCFICYLSRYFLTWQRGGGQGIYQMKNTLAQLLLGRGNY